MKFEITYKVISRSDLKREIVNTKDSKYVGLCFEASVARQFESFWNSGPHTNAVEVVSCKEE